MFALLQINIKHSVFCIQDTQNAIPLKLVHYCNWIDVYICHTCSRLFFLSVFHTFHFLPKIRSLMSAVEQWKSSWNSFCLFFFVVSVANRLQWHFSVISHFWQTKKAPSSKWAQKIYSRTSRIAGWKKTESCSVLYIGLRNCANKCDRWL